MMLLCAAVLLWQAGVRAAPVPLPPLPGEEGPVTPIEAFSLFPGSGEIPPESIAPDEPDPVQPPPETSAVDQLPDVEPLGLPSDGEAMPDLPAVPGLIVPTYRPANPAGGVPSVRPDGVPDLLPLPEVQLAKKSTWYRSPREARKVSLAERKPLLLFFAQLWDGPTCGTVQLNNDLFSMPEFKEFAASRLVLTMLQYPVGSPGKNYSEAKLAALDQFKTYFKVKGFPTVILIDETGRELERFKGYRRVTDQQSGQVYSGAHVLLDRLKEAEHRHSERRRYKQERIDNLTSQGYRIWTSRKGSTMMGKLVEAKPERIILKDENGRWRQVLPVQLILYDAEWARRKQSGLITDTPPKKETAASDASLSSRP
jgi:hypothetical protein